MQPDLLFKDFMKKKKCQRCKKVKAYAMIRQHPVCRKCYHLLKTDNQILIKMGKKIPKSLILKHAKKPMELRLITSRLFF